MKIRLAAVAAVLASLIATDSLAESVTGSASGGSAQDGCAAARKNALDQIPKDKKPTKWSSCKCQGGGALKNCTIGAEY